MRTIYLVDQPSDRRLAEALKDAGYCVVAVDDAETALAALRAIRADAFVIDAGTPAVGGERLLRELRSRADYRHAPVLLIGAQPGTYRRLSGAVGAGEVLLEHDRWHVLDRLRHVLPEDDAAVGMREAGARFAWERAGHGLLAGRAV